MYIDRLHTHHLSPVGLFCCCKWKPNIHKRLYMGYCLCDNYTYLRSHPLLHLHFIRYSTASGAGGFKHRTGEKWLEPWLCSVCEEYASPVNQKLMEGFLLRLHDFSRGASEAHLLLCGFVMDNTAHIQMRRQINHPRRDSKLSSLCSRWLWRFLATFLRPVFAASRVPTVCIHSFNCRWLMTY